MGDRSFEGYGTKSVYPLLQCCLCGEAVPFPTPSRMCHTCLAKNVDISQGVSTRCAILRCCSCEKFFHERWVTCELESKELLSLCLRKVKGLDTLNLIDAKFNWMEPHSKRLRVQALVQKEVERNCVAEQTILIDFSINSTQCNNCKQMYTPHTWKALVQIRQKTKDKKHILLLEQIILKHNAHENVLRVLSRQNGFDLHFANRTAAQKFADFVSDKIVSQTKNSKKLITQDAVNNKYNYKYTIQITLVPICIDDLVFLPKKIANMNGGISQFLLCTSLSTTIGLVDPFTLRSLDVSNEKYWRSPFTSLFNKFNLCEFLILNVERDRTNKNARHSHFELVDVEIMPLNSSTIIYTKSHLGRTLVVGDTYSGYDIRRINLNGFMEEETDIENRIPYDVILVRRVKPKKVHSKHNWVLKRIVTNNKDESEEEIGDEELMGFKDELANNEELQGEIDFYRDPRCAHGMENNRSSSEDDISAISVQLKELSLQDTDYF